MAAKITILGIAGSLRKDSYNKALLRAAQEVCPQGAAIEIFDLAGVPVFNQDDEPVMTMEGYGLFKVRAASAAAKS